MLYFPKNLSHLRREKSLTLNKIGEKLNFSATQWNNYELGNSYPKFLDLIKISKYFEVSESDLIHIDLEVNHRNSQKKKISQDEILSLQKKIIKLQEEKINELEREIINLKKSKH